MCAYSYIFTHHFLGLKPPGNTKRQTQMQCHDKMPSLMCNNKIAPNAANEGTQLIASCTSLASFNHRTSGGAISAAAAAISLFIPFADSSSRGRPSVAAWVSKSGIPNGIFVTDVQPLLTKQPPPPHGRIQRPRSPMQRRVHVIKEIPNMPNHHAHDLILRHGAMHHKAHAHQHPRQVWRAEDEQAQEAHEGIRIAARPYVHQRRGQGVAQEGHGHEGG